ncbi:MAG: sensor domain-containing diguanylate cyclase [Clostridia bacterium]|jgi:diguanylate cyclase (GGDEF)-like protein|nr:sensor domain-containing diguanylate cyclase [Clostridia bacterium]
MNNRLSLPQPYRIATAILIVFICSAIAYFYLISSNNIGSIYQEETQNTIIELKQSFLKNTVDNLIHEIDVRRDMETERYKNILNLRYDTLDYEKKMTDAEFTAYCIAKFELDYALPGDPYHWTALVWNNSNDTLLYDPDGLFEQSISDTLKKIEPEMSSYRIVRHGNISCFCGFSREHVNSRVKTSTAEYIRRLKFDNDSYIWVNEVINYEGGKDYAVRLVHPNLPETEGMLLSTDMTDIKGNLPYLTELEGVKKDGELFSRYYFKELNNESITEKISYAKLYKEYDWIVSMGVQINEMEKYITQTNDRSKKMAVQNTLQLLIVLIAVVFFCLALIILMEKRSFKHTQKQLESEINIDPLTNAGSRRFGTRILLKAFKEYKNNGAWPAIVMFDIDNFKFINDNYGHDTGDRVLKTVVESIQKIIRSEDVIIRWGGDEFLGIFYGIRKEHAEPFARKLLGAVSSAQLTVNNETINLTISIGLSYFKEEDTDYSDVVQRADQAMYKSKAEGRNKVNVL